MEKYFNIKDGGNISLVLPGQNFTSQGMENGANMLVWV